MENNRNWQTGAALILAGLALLVALAGRGGPQFEFTGRVASGPPNNQTVAPQAAAAPGASSQAQQQAAQAQQQAAQAQLQAQQQAEQARLQAQQQAEQAQLQAQQQAEQAQLQAQQAAPSTTNKRFWAGPLGKPGAPVPFGGVVPRPPPFGGGMARMPFMILGGLARGMVIFLVLGLLLFVFVRRGRRFGGPGAARFPGPPPPAGPPPGPTQL